MTLDEAKKVAMVCQEADGNCPHCIRALCYHLSILFPQFEWTFQQGVDLRPEEHLQGDDYRQMFGEPPDFLRNCNTIRVCEKGPQP